MGTVDFLCGKEPRKTSASWWGSRSSLCLKPSQESSHKLYLCDFTWHQVDFYVISKHLCIVITDQSLLSWTNANLEFTSTASQQVWLTALMSFQLQKKVWVKNAFLWVYTGTGHAAVSKDMLSFLTGTGKRIFGWQFRSNYFMPSTSGCLFCRSRTIQEQKG